MLIVRESGYFPILTNDTGIQNSIFVVSTDCNFQSKSKWKCINLSSVFASEFFFLPCLESFIARSFQKRITKLISTDQVTSTVVLPIKISIGSYTLVGEL